LLLKPHLGREQPEVVLRQLGVAVLHQIVREADKLRAADSTRPKERLASEKVRPIGFIGKDIFALEKTIADPREIIKQNQALEIPRLLDQQRQQEEHHGIDR
jgi:hypothetical protein